MQARLLLLLATAAGIGVLWASSDASDDTAAEPVVHAARSDATPLRRGAGAPAPASAPAPAPALLTLRQRHAPEPHGEANSRFFAATSWAPPPPPPPLQQAQLAPPAPVAPPLPFVVVGRQSLAGRDEVLLAQGERLLGVRAGTVIDGRYRVEAVDARVLTLVYLPLNQTQQLAIRASN